MSAWPANSSKDMVTIARSRGLRTLWGERRPRGGGGQPSDAQTLPSFSTRVSKPARSRLRR